MFKRSEGMGDVVLTAPLFSRPITSGVMELIDPSQQVPLWIFNFSDYSVKVKLFADGRAKQGYTLGPHDDNAESTGGDGSSQISALILVCRPEFENMSDNPMVVFFRPNQVRTIKAECEVVPSGPRVALKLRYYFATPENATPWTQAFEAPE